MVKFEKFHYWIQMALPAVYSSAELSYQEVLAKIITFLNNTLQEYVDNINEIDARSELNKQKIATMEKEIKEITSMLEKILNGENVDFYITSLENWIDKNLQELVGRIVKYVSFGLTADGYFVAYIPDSWKFLKFDTILDPNSPLYNHLIMQW